MLFGIMEGTTMTQPSRQYATDQEGYRITLLGKGKQLTSHDSHFVYSTSDND